LKRLSILRHAKSDWGDAELDDFDRPLNDRGWKAARRMGRELKGCGITFDVVIASPAARVRETLDGMTEKLKLNVEIHFEPQMYLATEETLIQIVRGLPASVDAPLLVGHNPGLQQLVLRLTRRGGKRDHVAQKFPTAALARIALPARRWADVAPASGEIDELILPKERD
jgi:phosphohistidine phosphatase